MDDSDAETVRQADQFGVVVDLYTGIEGVLPTRSDLPLGPDLAIGHLPALPPLVLRGDDVDRRADERLTGVISEEPIAFARQKLNMPPCLGIPLFATEWL